MAAVFQAEQRQQAQHDHRHVRHSAGSRVEPLLQAMAARVSKESGPKVAFHCPHGAAACGGFDAFDARVRNFLGNLPPLRREFASSTKIKACRA
jgi:hypothetical protein